MAKRQASLLSFCQYKKKWQRVPEENTDNDQDQESDDSDCQDVQVEDSPEEYEQESEHSCHSITYDVNIKSPDICLSLCN